MKQKEANAKIQELEAKIAELREIVNKPQDLFSTIKNYEDVVDALDEKKLYLSDFNFLTPEYRGKALAQAQIQQIEKLFNGTWKKDWSDSNQKKWYPYFENRLGGFGFNGSGCSDCCVNGVVGFYKNRETSDFVGKTFLEIYKKAL